MNNFILSPFVSKMEVKIGNNTVHTIYKCDKCKLEHVYYDDIDPGCEYFEIWNELSSNHFGEKIENHKCCDNHKK